MSYRTNSQQQQQKEVPGSSRLNTSTKPTSSSLNNNNNNNNVNSSSRTGSIPQQQLPPSSSTLRKSADPLLITPEQIWATRQKQQQQQNADGTNESPAKQPTRRSGTPTGKDNSNQDQKKPSTASGDFNVSKSKNGPNSPTTPNQKLDVQTEALMKSQASERAAHEKAFQLSKSNNTVLTEEVTNLREENAQLRDIEKQFWILLDEREQLQEEVQRLHNGISSSNNNNNNQNANNGKGSNKNQHDSSSQYHNKYYSHVRVPQIQSEAEKNYTQMAVALDEALNMLIQLDRTAASRFSGSSQQQSSVVLPGSLIYRFLEFCSAERMNTLQIGTGGMRPGSNFLGGGQQQQQSQQSGSIDPLQQMHQNIQELTRNSANSRSGSNVVPSQSQQQQQQQQTPGKILDASYQQQQTNQGPATKNIIDSSFQSTIHSANLSQALRLTQDEIHHLKMELDRSDLSRLQALDDVDKMQRQIQVLSSSIVELRSAYASARAQADANAKSAETVHDVTVKLAEREAEIAHLKARVAEMQRLAASGGSALSADTTRIRQELASRVSNKY